MKSGYFPIIGAVLCCALIGCATTPPIAFPNTPSGTLLRSTYEGTDGIRKDAIERMMKLAEEGELEEATETASKIVAVHADPRLWLIAFLAFDQRRIQQKPITLSSKWLPILVGAFDNPNEEQAYLSRKMPPVAAASLLCAFPPDQVRPYKADIARRFNAPLAGPLAGESPEGQTRLLLSFALWSLGPDGVPGLVRGLDHHDGSLRLCSLLRIEELLTGETANGLQSAPNRLFQPFTPAQEQAIRQSLYPYLPTFIAAVKRTGESRDAIWQETATSIVAKLMTHDGARR